MAQAERESRPFRTFAASDAKGGLGINPQKTAVLFIEVSIANKYKTHPSERTCRTRRPTGPCTDHYDKTRGISVACAAVRACK